MRTPSNQNQDNQWANETAQRSKNSIILEANKSTTARFEDQEARAKLRTLPVSA